jgi:hypothetical protein
MKFTSALLPLVVLVSLTLANAANITASVNHRQAKAFRMDKEKTIASNEISQFLNTKNIVKTIVKLVFGNSEESTATSRQVLNLLVKVLDMLKTSFTQRNARSASSSNRGLKESIDDAAVASISMLKGFVRSALSTDQQCVQKHICEAATQASRESRELGYVISQFGGYASSYVLDSQKSIPTNANYEAARFGRSGGSCQTKYNCSEKDF